MKKVIKTKRSEKPQSVRARIRRIRRPGRDGSYFVDGLARILDFRGSLVTRYRAGIGWEADVEALRSDWVVVGNDIRMAITEFDCEEANRVEENLVIQ